MRRAPRLVLVVPGFPKLSESFIVSKFVGLLDRGWDVHIACGTSSGSEWSHFPGLVSRNDCRARVHVSPSLQATWCPVFPLASRLLALLRAPRTVASYVFRGLQDAKRSLPRRLITDAAIVGLKPDLIHFEFGALAVGRTHLKDWLGCRLTCSFRGYDLNYSGLEDEDYYAQVWAHMDAIHVLGNDLWNRAIRRGCPPGMPHAVIPPAIDLSKFSHVSRDSEARSGMLGTTELPLRILSVGRLEWKKGYEYCLEAVARLARQGLECQYHIIGNGSYLEAVAFARHEMGLASQVKLLLAQPSEVVRRELAWADVFLHGAVSEGFCNGVIEAQAMRLPVVCSDADGLGENIENGKTGILVERRNSAAMADALVYLAKNPDVRVRMGTAGRRRAETCFCLADQIARLDAFYREVLRPKATCSHRLAIR